MTVRQVVEAAEAGVLWFVPRDRLANVHLVAEARTHVGQNRPVTEVGFGGAQRVLMTGGGGLALS